MHGLHLAMLVLCAGAGCEAILQACRTHQVGAIYCYHGFDHMLVFSLLEEVFYRIAFHGAGFELTNTKGNCDTQNTNKKDHKNNETNQTRPNQSEKMCKTALTS